MFKNYKNLVWAAALGMSSLAMSCKKGIDIIPNDPSRYARIERIDFTPSQDNQSYSNRTVTFNDQGEPLLSYSGSYSTGDPNDAYTYHSNGQLKERVLFFGETPDSYYAEHNNIFILYTYAYDAKGRIASDTNHYIGGLAIDSNRSIQSYTEYTYDDKNRIVSEKIVFPRWNFSQVNTYEYGADGNLVGGVYDKNVNPLRLSKVLAFIAKDYSVNNRTGDDLTYEYNKYKLPVKITGSSNVLAGHYGAGTFNITYIKK